MRKYNVIFAYLDKNGCVELDNEGYPYFRNKVIEAYNKGEALDKLREQEKFLVEPEIIEVKEIRGNGIINKI